MRSEIYLRNCPMCRTAPGDEGVILTAEALIDLSDRTQVYEVGYTVRCCNCGCSVSDEDMTDVVLLWNGVQQ